MHRRSTQQGLRWSAGELWLLLALLPSAAWAAAPASHALTPKRVGQISEYRLPRGYASPQAITTGPDGNLWFTESRDGPYWGDKIGKITTK